MKVAFCVPCRDTMMTGTAFDMARLAAYDGANRCATTGGSFLLYTAPGTLIFSQRESLAKEALADGAEYILWVDSDMRFPKNTLERLLAHGQKIVGVNAVTRRKPVLPTAINFHEDKEIFEKIESRGKKGIEEVTAVGFGVVLTHKSVFEAMPQPWFDVVWGAGGLIGEDVHFCVKALDHGIKTFVDHELSLEIGHIGTHEYRWSDVEYGPKHLQRTTDDHS